MAKSILEFVKTEEVLDFARRLNPEIFLGLEIFKPRMVDELNYSYIKGVGGNKASIMADVVAWESSAPLAPHEGLARVEGELPPIKQKSRFSEQEVIKIFNPRSTRERAETIKKLYNDVQARVDGVHSRLNWITMQSLAEGKVVFTSEGNKLTVDWGVPVGQVKVPSALWSDHTNADPVADILALQSTVKSASGAFCDRAITSNTIIGHILQCVKVKTQMFGTGETSRILTLDALNSFLTSLGLPTLFAYDELVKVLAADRTISNARYYPENRMTLIPGAENLGETLYGPTAEAIRGLAAEEAPGIFAEVYETKDPVNVWTYAVATAFPTFPGADQIGIMKPIA
jgi:hypothetical protein